MRPSQGLRSFVVSPPTVGALDHAPDTPVNEGGRGRAGLRFGQGEQPRVMGRELARRIGVGGIACQGERLTAAAAPVDFPGLRRSGIWSQIVDQAQDFLEQVLWHSHLGQLDRDVATMW